MISASASTDCFGRSIRTHEFYTSSARRLIDAQLAMRIRGFGESLNLETGNVRFCTYSGIGGKVCFQEVTRSISSADIEAPGLSA
ncbi:hypothetical protein CIT26_26030 [Mesorhizobium temperatum]|uniref:Uncharacterized protein n=1 Tax=Mesorhizobium temperatum TaxID=241416 RepID=A0A271LEN5_9HYPH|nr:hypothetical protein CIT26_26030 [Mesorhizobium temperatum]